MAREKSINATEKPKKSTQRNIMEKSDKKILKFVMKTQAIQ
jgi:hypothetical protein